MTIWNVSVGSAPSCIIKYIVRVKIEVTVLQKKNSKNILLLVEYDELHFDFNNIFFVSYVLITL